MPYTKVLYRGFIHNIERWRYENGGGMKRVETSENRVIRVWPHKRVQTLHVKIKTHISDLCNNVVAL